MHPAELRLKNLKERLKAEPNKKSLYAMDLKESIKSQEILVKNTNKDGYKMVKV